MEIYEECEVDLEQELEALEDEYGSDVELEFSPDYEESDSSPEEFEKQNEFEKRQTPVRILPTVNSVI